MARATARTIRRSEKGMAHPTRLIQSARPHEPTAAACKKKTPAEAVW